MWPKLFSGPLVYIAIVMAPFEGVDPSARSGIGLVIWMALWWITTPVPISVTAFVPLVVGSITPYVAVEDVLRFYASPIVILLIGANMITVAWASSGLDKRIALFVLSKFGTTVKYQIIIWFILSIFLTMFLPNTVVATAFVPIVLSMLRYVGIDKDQLSTNQIATGFLLAIAWGTSIGGFGSPLGGAMNLVTINLIQDLVTGEEFMFFAWVVRMFPLLILLSIPILIYLFSFPYETNVLEGSKDYYSKAYSNLSTFSQGEKWSLIIFVLAIVTVFMRPLYAELIPQLEPAYVFLVFGLATFVAPAGKNKRLLTWEYAESRMMWGLFYLFAGGIALGNYIGLSGADELLVRILSPAIGGGGLLTVAVFGALALLLSNVSSNTAACAVVIPLVIHSTQAMGINPIPYAYIATVAANAGLILPTSAGRAVAVGYGLNSRIMASRGLFLSGFLYAILVLFGFLFLKYWPTFSTTG